MSCKDGDFINCLSQCTNCDDPTMDNLNSRNDQCQKSCGTYLNHAYADVKSICHCCPRTHIIPCDKGTDLERKKCYLDIGYQYYDEECVTSNDPESQHCSKYTGVVPSKVTMTPPGTSGPGITNGPKGVTTSPGMVTSRPGGSTGRPGATMAIESYTNDITLKQARFIRGLAPQRHETIEIKTEETDPNSSVGAELNGKKLGGLHVNAMEYIGCDYTFPYKNDLELMCDTPWRGQQKDRYIVKNGGGYLKYEKMTDNIALVSMNPRQGKDKIADIGIMRTTSIDPLFQAESITNNNLNVSIVERSYPSLSEEDRLLESRLNNRVVNVSKGTVNIDFDFFTCQYGTLAIRDTTFIKNVHKYYIFGLGPITTNTTNNFSLNWADNKRRCNQSFGTMQGFGIYGSHWPVMYVLRVNQKTNEQSCYMVYFDHFRKTEYFFDDLQTQGVLKIRSREPEFRFYVSVEDTILKLRKQFMKITGSPQPPVQKAMGLWIQKFGYKDWEDLEKDVKRVRDGGFPVDGFIFDLYWFGHFFPEPLELNANSYDMNFCHQRKALTFANELGKFKWDKNKFPQHKEYLNNLMKKYNYGATLIEEPYITADAEDFSFMYYNDMIAKLPSGSWAEPEGVWNKWIGQHSAMPDFTNPDTAKHWFSTRIVPNITDGTFFWWNDLSEPECSNENALYLGIGQVTNNGEMLHEMHQAPDVLNFNQLLWTKGLCEEYNSKLNKRYNVLCRAGTVGIQRYGAFMWPGDSFPKLVQLNACTNSLSNLVLSGLDFSATDAGGFGWSDGEDERQKLYSIWYANSAATNFTLKPHKYGQPGQDTAAPTEWGSVPDNLSATLERYKFAPYYYSSAMDISMFGDKKGEPFTTTLFFKYQNDSSLLKEALEDRKNSLTQFVGPSLIYGMLYKYGETSRTMYFPKDEMFYDYRNDKWLKGGTSYTIQFKNQNTCPLFIKDKSIIPTRRITTKNNLNMRYNDVLSCYDVYIYSYDNTNADDFTLYIDDGISMNRNQQKIRLSYKNGVPSATSLSGSRSVPQFNFIIVNKDGVKNPVSQIENFSPLKEIHQSGSNNKMIWYIVLIVSFTLIGYILGKMFKCSSKKSNPNMFALIGMMIGVLVSVLMAMKNKT